MLTCRELIGFLSDDLPGTLDPEERARFDEHLAVCPSCVAYLTQLDAVVRLAREAFRAGDPAGAEMPPELIRAVLDARRRKG